MTVHELTIQPKYLDFIRTGLKKVEGRVNDEKKQAIQVGDILVLQTPECDKSEFTVIRRSEYPTIEEMLKNEGVSKMLPDVDNLEDGIALYRSLGDYAKKEPIYGMVALELTHYK
uniref:DUF3850 domain-containing protein n=1 Tax=Acrobeloides nanus TaxID=290746 RepID=A0A914EN18_9BILA